MPGISSAMGVILLYSGWWETDTDGRTGTIYPSFEGVALPISTLHTAGHVCAIASFTDPHTQVAPLLVQSVLVSK